MPTYEYECLKCGHKFEKFQNMTDEPVKRCSKCKGNVRRLIGAGTGIISKGSSQDVPCCGMGDVCANAKYCEGRRTS